MVHKTRRTSFVDRNLPRQSDGGSGAGVSTDVIVVLLFVKKPMLNGAWSDDTCLVGRLYDIFQTSATVLIDKLLFMIFISSGNGLNSFNTT